MGRLARRKKKQHHTLRHSQKGATTPHPAGPTPSCRRRGRRSTPATNRGEAAPDGHLPQQGQLQRPTASGPKARRPPTGERRSWQPLYTCRERALQLSKQLPHRGAASQSSSASPTERRRRRCAGEGDLSTSSSTKSSGFASSLRLIWPAVRHRRRCGWPPQTSRTTPRKKSLVCGAATPPCCLAQLKVR